MTTSEQIQHTRLDKKLTTRSLAVTSLVYCVATGVQKLVVLLILLYLGRQLRSTAYAEFALLYALQTALATFVGAGIVEAVSGGLVITAPIDRKKLLEAANLTFLGQSTIAVAVSICAFLWFSEAGVMSPLLIVPVVVCGLLVSYSLLQASLVRLVELHRASLFIGVATTIGGAVGAIVGLSFYLGSVGFFCGTAVGYGVALLASRTKLVGFTFEPDNIKRALLLLSKALPYVLISFFTWLSGYGNAYIIKVCFDEVEVARFYYIYTIASVMPLVATAQNQVWGPRFFAMIYKTGLVELVTKYRRISDAQGLLLGITAVSIMITSAYVIPLVGGNIVTYTRQTPKLAIVLFGHLLCVPWWNAQNFYYAFNSGKQLFTQLFLSYVSSTIALIFLINCLGVDGVYVGFALQMLIRSALVHRDAHRRWGVLLPWIGSLLGGSAIIFGLIICS
jgi:O-antigen/teichoic acid export membrane protein